MYSLRESKRANILVICEEVDMFSVIVNVSIAPGQFEAARSHLRERVVTGARSAPGFVKGYWTANAERTRGTSIAVFQSKENAESAVGMIRNNPVPPGVTLNDVEVREVIAEA
jgi:hypothetical protein